MKDLENNETFAAQPVNKIHFEQVVTLQPKTFTHLDLFSGIGGFALAAKSVFGERYKNVGFCEIDEFCHKVLRKNFGQDIKIIDDIKKITEYKFGTVDLITGGDPCQPFSKAGRKRGTDDNRALWSYMYGAILKFRPTWIINENVVGSKNMVLDRKIEDLELGDYRTRQFIIPAEAVGTTHKRERLFIIAHANGIGREKKFDETKLFNKKIQKTSEGEFGRTMGFLNREQLIAKYGGRNDGLSTKLDADRIKALGNAIVPQVAIELLAAIKTVNDNECQY